MNRALGRLGFGARTSGLALLSAVAGMLGENLVLPDAITQV